MSEPEHGQRMATPTTEPPEAMSDAAIDRALAELGAVVEEIIEAARAADVRMDEMSDASEVILTRRQAMGRRVHEPDPQSAYISWQDDLSTEVARRYRAAGREFVTWWADLSMVAVVAALLGLPVRPARAAAAEPHLWFPAEDLAHLPPVPEDARTSAALSLSIAAAPPTPAAPRDDFWTKTEDFLARSGLFMRHDQEDGLITEEDGSTDGRRARLWGSDWFDDRVPTLPTAVQLAEELSKIDVPADTVAAIRDAAVAVESAVAAQRRARELDNAEPEDAELAAAQALEAEALWNEADSLTDLLVTYARTLTGSLAAVRVALAAHPR